MVTTTPTGQYRLVKQTGAVPAMGLRLKPPQMSLTPTLKQTGPESGDQLCGKFLILSFVCSKNNNVNHVCKLLQLLASPLDHPGGLPSPRFFRLQLSQMEIPDAATGRKLPQCTLLWLTLSPPIPL